MRIHSVPVVEQDIDPRTEKRQRILRAAVEVFAQRGFFNAKVSEVARAAGVADGTIYLYFSGKEDLLISIFRDSMRTYLGRLRDALAKESTPPQRLSRLMAVHLENLGADRNLAVVFQVEFRQSLKYMSLFSREEFGEYLDILRGIIEEGQRSGEFRSDLPSSLVAKSVFGILDEMVTSWMLSDKDHRPAEQVAELASFVLGGLRVAARDGADGTSESAL